MLSPNGPTGGDGAAPVGAAAADAATASRPGKGRGGAPTAPSAPPPAASKLSTGRAANPGWFANFLPTDYATRSSAPTTASLGRADPLHLYLTGSQAAGSASASRSSRQSGATTGTGSAGQPPRAGSGLGAFEIPFSELEIVRVLGEGSYGRVYLAEWHATPCAVKLLLSDAPAGTSSSAPHPISSSLLSKLEEEADVMLALRHPNCVSIMGIVASPPCLVTEYCEFGSLTAVLWAAREDQDKAAALTWGRRLAIALDAAKVGDYNLSKIYQESSTGRSSTAAAMNPRWLSPEVMQGERAGPPADVFAFGVCLWELLTWQLPWQAANPWQVVAAVTRGDRLPLPSSAELPGPHRLPPPQYKAFLALLVRCWAQHPAERPTFGAVIESLRALLQAVGPEGSMQS
ncbi:Serine threonine- kinase CTR1 [Chlorella sorokiniana]|uniref:Serine threonine-kinase CTR1 n=1 Tax=Chlorella sorokiniana TaxID=3076 RepID=A0A2P6U4L8_CHLSO|nr:Serine threonine- kinase CTR1 [Chlorella sorokiniana]|eukprot:PRW61246.1 Serine threonine- kinase CTR1 [Chlorella sorokiniana]